MSNGETTAADTKAPEYPGIAALVNKLLPQIPFTATQTTTDVDLRVAPEHLIPLVTGLKEKKELSFDFLRNSLGLDMEEEGLEAKYQFYSFKHGHAVQVTVPTPPGNPRIPTLTGLYPAADWHEREAMEMFGLVFEGHP